MSTTTNRTLTASLALALALGVAACGTDDPGTGGTPSATTDASATDDTTADDSADDGAADDTADDSADDTSSDEATGSDDAGTGAAADPTAAALEAVATAEAEAGGTAYEIDDSDDDGSWEVDVAVDDRSVEVTVSADGLTVTGTEDDDLDDEDRAGLDAAEVTLQDAIVTGVGEVSGVLDDVELEDEDGTHVWVVSVDGTESGDDDVEVLVDVTTGDVVRVED